MSSRTLSRTKSMSFAGRPAWSAPGHPDTSSLALAAGESATVNSGGLPQGSSALPAADLTRGMLQFDRTPLADAVRIANRYSERRIILVGDLYSLRITGAFHAGDTAGLAQTLAAAFELSLQQRADGSLVLSRRSPK